MNSKTMWHAPSAQQLTESWERGIKRALEEQPRAEELDAQLLHVVAGLEVKSGHRAGDIGSWTGCSCQPC